jgi:hypothetical protein
MSNELLVLGCQVSSFLKKWTAYMANIIMKDLSLTL